EARISQSIAICPNRRNGCPAAPDHTSTRDRLAASLLTARVWLITLARNPFPAIVTKSHFGPKPQPSEWSLCSSVSGDELGVEGGKGRDQISRLTSQRSLWAWSR